MKMTLKAAALAALACASLVTLTTGKADAHRYHRIYIGPHYAVGAVYHYSKDLPWYAVRAYYWGGPWSGPYYSWAGWKDYAARNGIACTPGWVVKGGDGIWYNCQ